MRKYLILEIVGFLSAISITALGGEPSSQKFERIVIDDNFPGGYQVEVADVNGDKKPDILALGGSTLAWYENPTWKKRVVSTAKETPDIISSATADLDGDGKAEIAIAFDFSMNEPKRGKLTLAVQGGTVDDPWTFQQIAIVPSIHRLRWGDVDGNGKLELVVAPLFGPNAKGPAFDQDSATLRAFFTGLNPKLGRWNERPLASRTILHAVEVRPSADPTDRRATILTADFRGVAKVRWPWPGKQEPEVTELTPPTVSSSSSIRRDPPKKPIKPGSSEVHLGHLGTQEFLATIDPWHGSEVAIRLYKASDLYSGFQHREVIDNTLKDGHALWVADVDGDGDDEVFAGYRGGEGGVLMFDFDGKVWNKTILDPKVTAQDLRGGDIDGDGTPDVVAIGGKSHNVVWYRPIP